MVEPVGNVQLSFQLALFQEGVYETGFQMILLLYDSPTIPRPKYKKYL